MKTLLYTTTAFVLCGNIVQANAACIATPSCDALGYTSSTSCTNGIKCPFGNKWFCPKEEKCVDFPYVCAGQGYADGGGIGETCEGKYAKCTCEDGFEWIEGKGCIGKCIIGSILFSDKTCSMYMRAGKTPIGIVVYTNSTGGGQAIATQAVGEDYWSHESTLSSLDFLYKDEYEASQDFASCENTNKIITIGDDFNYPAAWAAHEYSTEGTNAGDWCLPAAGILVSIKRNKTAIDQGLKNIGKDSFNQIWSSTPVNRHGVYYSEFEKYTEYGISSYDGFRRDKSIYPVIEF